MTPAPNPRLVTPRTGSEQADYDPEYIAGVLELSDERDTWMRRLDTAYREGYAAASTQFTSQYERGWTDAILAVKKAQHGVVADVRTHLRAWDGLRTHFADPRPGDFKGTERRERGDAA